MPLGRIFIKSFLIIAFAGFQPLRAQEPIFRVLDYTVGLPSNTVYNILQDKKGYMWIGHDKGLTRYNGSQLNNYSNNMNQSRALSNLDEDKYGRIWCQNFSGEMFYTGDNGLEEVKELKSTGNYISFTLYNKQKVISTRNQSLIEYDIDTRKITNIVSTSKKFTNTNILASGKDIYAFSDGKNEITKFVNFKQKRVYKVPAKVNPIMCIVVDGDLISFPRIGIDNAAIFKEDGTIKLAKLNIKTIIQNVILINGDIWISTTEGAYIFDKNLKPKGNGEALFPQLNISKILQDHEGSIWFSSLNKGVIIVPNMNVQLLKLNPNSFTTASYFSSTDKIILGTGDNRVFEFNSFTYQLKLLYDFEIRHDVVNIYNDVSNDLIWISSDKMYGIKVATNSVELEKSYPMKDIEFLGGNTYVTAGPEGVSLFCYTGDTINNYFSNIFKNTTNKWSLDRQLLVGSEGRSKCVAYEPISKTLYASNYRGLFIWSPDYNGVILDHGKPIYASDMTVKGTKVYVVTYNGSLYVIEGKVVLKAISGFAGLEKKSITTIKSEGDNLWLLYENAIVKYNIFSGKYAVIRASDGLPNAEIKDLVVLNNKVFLATRIGLVLFPEDLKNQMINPLLEIEEILVNKEKVRSKNYNYYLQAGENNLDIGFSVITFRENKDIAVYYRINNKSWISLEPGSSHLNLVNLSPGLYNIQLKAVKIDGTEILSPAIMQFHIASPVWTRWWFVLLIVLFLGFLAYNFMRFRINELRKEAEFKSAKDRLERELQLSTLTSIKSQMNPHFVFNALNTVQAYIFTNDKDNAIEYLNKFSELTRMILDMSSREKISLSEEIKALNLYLELEKKRFEDNFEYQLIITESISPELIQIPSMLIQPYVENAIKHGLLHKMGERRLKIELVKEENSLVVFIDDNGIGRKRSYEMKQARPSGHKSFASEANKKRLQLLNQGRANPIDIEFLDKMDIHDKAEGTMVILAIPLNF